MRVICIGDVVGSAGCVFLAQKLPPLKRTKGIDIVVCNGENSADGNGVLPTSADSLFSGGVDVLTLGNHSFRRREIYTYLEENPYIIRPANYPEATTPGRGVCVLDCGSYSIAVINLMGNVFNPVPVDCPFTVVDRLLSGIETKNIIVDVHAEATSEKRALGFYLDSRVSAVFGTHTHVQTADEQVLKNGTGYITDVGMTGPVDSVLGVKPHIVISSLKDKLPIRFESEQTDCAMDCVIFDINEKTGRCRSVERLSIR